MILVLLDLFKGNEKLYNKLYSKYRLEFDQLKDEIDDKQMEQIKSPNQQENWISWTKLSKLPTSWRRKLRNNKKSHYLMFMTLLSYLYLSTSELPPLRNTYINMKYFSKNEKPTNKTENYYWKNQFYFNNTKSGRRYTIKLTKRSLKLIRLVEEYRKFNKTEWFLVHPTAKRKLYNSEYSKYMMEMTQPSGKEIGARMLRTIYVSEIVPTMKLKDQLETAKRMDHKLETQLVYYKKN